MQSFTHFLIPCLCLCGLLACTSDKTQQTAEADSHAESTAPWELLVGAYTGQGSEGIYLFDVDPATGKLSNQRLTVETVNPSYLTMSKDRAYVYAVNETEDGQVSSFQWNEDRSQLMPLSQQAALGDAPCYVEINDAENLLAVGNYLTGNIAVFSVNEQGLIQDSPVAYQHEGSGPVQPNQVSAHAHCVKFDPNGRFLYAVDLGIDQVISYPISEAGAVGAASSRLAFDPGDGPRHLIFHPNKAMAFVVNELSSSVVSLAVDHTTGQLTKIEKVSTLPDDFEGTSYCADIHLSPDAKFLYASNRGHNSIAIFSVSENGELNRVGVEPVRGDWPRNFTLSPDGRYLLVANQKSNNITVFEVDPNTGLLTFTGQEVSISQPVVMKF